jgi:hypothetical protein
MEVEEEKQDVKADKDAARRRRNRRCRRWGGEDV